MSSRRTRIKGLANIPQRRKTGPTNNEDNQHEDPPKPEIANEIKPSETPNLKPETDQNAEHQLKTEPTPTTPPNTHVTLKSDTDTKTAVIEPAKAKPPILRRRFIKPAVSASVINRRAKAKVTDEEDEKQTENVEPKPNTIEEEVVNIILNETQIPVCNSGIANKKIEPLTTQGNNNKVAGIQRLSKPLYIDGTKSGSDTEYPAPPASPNKFVNRTRIKAVPRLGQRRTSFSIGSASESEDENRRGYNRIRNDSVCSATSATHENQPFVDTNLSPVKKEFSSVIQRKCRRTEQSRKLAEARRDFQLKFNHRKPDRQRLTMIDLIFYNPTSNPMSQKKKSRLDTESSETIIDDPDADLKSDPNQEQTKPSKDEDATKATNEALSEEEENAVPAPQITIGINGEIIVDEKSLVIENKETIQNREALKKSEIVDGDFDTGYGVYKRVKRSKDWCKEETLRFYKALNTIGTDFTLMCELFPDRTRRELKMKFKKEERMNRALIDRAVMEPINFDMTDLRLDLEKSAMEKKEHDKRLKEIEKSREDTQGKKRVRKNKREFGNFIMVDHEENAKPISIKKIKKPKNEVSFLSGGINSILDSDSDNSTSTLATTASQATVKSDFSDSDDEKPQKIQKTRSGRISKPKHIEADQNEEKLVPGSIMIVSNTDDPNAKSPYTVYVVDDNCKKVEVELTPELLENLSKNNSDLIAKDKVENENNNTLSLNDTLDNNMLNATAIVFGEDSMIIPFDEFNLTEVESTKNDLEMSISKPIAI